MGPAGRAALDRVRRDRRGRYGALQGGAGALGARPHAGASRGARPGRRPRRGRAHSRRGAREVRRGAAPLSHARRGHGVGHHRHHHGRDDHGAIGRGPPGDHRASHDGRSGLSCRLPFMERVDSVVRSGRREDDRRVARMGAVRLRHHRGALVAGGTGRAADDRTMTPMLHTRPAPVARVFGRAEPGRAYLRPPSVLSVLMALATMISPAAAHHVGSYAPRDNAVTTNFKQIKFSVQAKRFDVALQLFESGAVRAEMRAQAATLPAGLEEATRAALRADDGPEVERRLMIFFAALARDLAVEADRQLGEPGDTLESRAATGRKFLEAIWRYYNLVDFAVAMRDSKSSVAVRLAFDEAESYVKPAAGSATPDDPTKARPPIQRIAQVLSTLIETSSTSARRSS